MKEMSLFFIFHRILLWKLKLLRTWWVDNNNYVHVIVSQKVTFFHWIYILCVFFKLTLKKERVRWLKTHNLFWKAYCIYLSPDELDWFVVSCDPGALSLLLDWFPLAIWWIGDPVLSLLDRFPLELWWIGDPVLSLLDLFPAICDTVLSLLPFDWNPIRVDSVSISDIRFGRRCRMELARLNLEM